MISKSLIIAPEGYSQEDERRFRREVEASLLEIENFLRRSNRGIGSDRLYSNRSFYSTPSIGISRYGS